MWAFCPDHYPETVNDPTEQSADRGVGSHAEGHLIQQAEVPPLDVDGVQAATVGTVLFGLATVVLVLGYDRLRAAGDAWWLGVAVSGLGLGLLSLGYTVIRRRRRRRGGPTRAGPTRGGPT
jgi:hypothetical protein